MTEEVTEDNQNSEQPTETHPAHPVNEDPEEHIGDELIDPWVDPEQTDWPNASKNQPEQGDEEAGE